MSQTNPVLIGLAGAGRRTGTTHATIQLATYLALRRLKIACVELPHPYRRQVFDTFHSEVPSKWAPGGFHLEQIDFFRCEQYFPAYILSANYDFILLDCAFICSQLSPEVSSLTHFCQAHLRVLTSGASLWDFHNLNESYSYVYDHALSYPTHTLINYADPSAMLEIHQAFSHDEIKMLKMKLVWNPFEPNPFQIQHKDSPFPKIVHEIMVGGM